MLDKNWFIFQLRQLVRHAYNIHRFIEKCEFQIFDGEGWHALGFGILAIIWSQEIGSYRIWCESDMEDGPLVKYCDLPITKQTLAEVRYIVLPLFVSF